MIFDSHEAVRNTLARDLSDAVAAEVSVEILGLDELAYPVKVISWLLPVTYGIRALQSIMLRGDPPSTEDIVGLGALIVGYGAFATLALMRKLRRA